MAFKFFTISLQDQDREEAALNAFLRANRVLSVDRKWVEQGSSSFWMFCLDYLEGVAPAPGGGAIARRTPNPRSITARR